MKNQLLTVRETPLDVVEARLREFMGGLDTRLTAVSATQALLSGAHARALKSAYGKAGVAAILERAGVVETLPLNDADTAAVLRARDRHAVPAASNFARQSGLPTDWHLDNTATHLAWNAVPGAPDAIDWQDVRIGHIDTGYTRHPAFGFDLAPWVDTANAETLFQPSGGGPVDPPPEPGKGLDPLVGGRNPGHGTKSASTVVGKAAGDSFYGVAPGCSILPVRICNTVWINDRQKELAQAIEYVTSKNVSVITVCLGIAGATTSRAVRKAIDGAYEAGVIMICAAGQYVRDVVSPARLNRTIAVAGTTHLDVPWSWSCHGPETDLSAPAADIYSAASGLRSGSAEYTYVDGGNGTTFATAMVSGACALWLLHRRADLRASYAKPWQRVEAFRRCVKASTRKPANWPYGFGDGILDVAALLSAGLPDAADLAKDQTAS